MQTPETGGESIKRHWLISLWPVWVIIGMMALTWYSDFTSSRQQEKAKVEQEAQQQRGAELQAEREAALLKRCTTEEADLVRTAQVALSKGALDEARAALQPCRAHLKGDASLVALKKLDALQAAATEKLQRERTANMAKVAAAEKAAKKRQGVRIGMSKQDALDSSWGRPSKVNTTTTATTVREQWVYDGGNYLYFTNGVLTSIQN